MEQNSSDDFKPYITTDIKDFIESDQSFMIPPHLIHRISIAPMFDVTDIHFRFFFRLLTRYATLWTEMLHFNSILQPNSKGYNNLRFNNIEHPVVVQLGGSDPTKLAECAYKAWKEGYDEINLNCGCPSPRVQSGSFGAC